MILVNQIRYYSSSYIISILRLYPGICLFFILSLSADGGQIVIMLSYTVLHHL